MAFKEEKMTRYILNTQESGEHNLEVHKEGNCNVAPRHTRELGEQPSLEAAIAVAKHILPNPEINECRNCFPENKD